MKRSAWAAALAAVAAFVSCWRVRVEEHMLFMPPRGAAEAAAPPWVEDFFFEAPDGARINAWYVPQPAARATVLLYGGNAFSLARSQGFVEAIGRHPVNLFMMDYRGYGRSQGTPTAAAFKSDALAAYDALRARFAADPARLILHGHSLGSFAAVFVAAMRPAAALVLQNPATNADDAVRRMLPWYARPFVRLEIAPALLAESNLERIAAVHIPTLVAGGARDRITSAAMARALYAACPSPDKRLVIVRGGGHDDLLFDPGFQAAYAAIIDAVGRRR